MTKWLDEPVPNVITECHPTRRRQGRFHAYMSGSGDTWLAVLLLIALGVVIWTSTPPASQWVGYHESSGAAARVEAGR